MNSRFFKFGKSLSFLNVQGITGVLWFEDGISDPHFHDSSRCPGSRIVVPRVQ